MQLLARHVQREMTGEGHLPQIRVGDRTLQRGTAGIVHFRAENEEEEEGQQSLGYAHTLEPKTLRGSQAAHCEPRETGGQHGRRRRFNTPATAGHRIVAGFPTTSAV